MTAGITDCTLAIQDTKQRPEGVHYNESCDFIFINCQYMLLPLLWIWESGGPTHEWVTGSIHEHQPKVINWDINTVMY